ncbi:YlxR family protein [Thermovibrio sp.]
MRTCGGCKKKGEVEEFIRFVEFEGKLFPDLARKLPGRGYNLCPSFNCIKSFIKKKFKGKLSAEEVYEETIKALKEYLLHLISLSHKTGITVIGQDEIKKLKRKEGVLILSKELSSKTKERLKRKEWLTLENIFSSFEVGSALRKETSVGALFIEKVGLGRKVYENARRLKMLLEERRDERLIGLREHSN